jgi:hypothetical protein
VSSLARRPSVCPSVVQDLLPDVTPIVRGAAAPGFTSAFYEGVGQEVQTQLGNAVSQEWMRAAQSEPLEEGILGALAGDAGGIAAAPPPTDGDPTDAATPSMTSAAQQLASAQGGDPLPSAVKDALAPTFGGDLGAVRVHRGESAVEDVDAGAAAFGQHVFFAPGAYDPSTPDGLGLIAHEVAHTTRRAPTGDDLVLGGTDTAAEGAAEAVADQVAATARGDAIATTASVAPAAGDGNTIQRGEAGVHQNAITMPGMGVEAAHLSSADNPNEAGHDRHGWRDRDSTNLSPDQRASLQVYAGNFMSDFSQTNTPAFLDIVSRFPTFTGGRGHAVGAAGGGRIIQALVRSFAILELGTEAAAVVTAANTEMYEGERHIDNPMGTSAEDYVVSSVSSGTALMPASAPAIPAPATCVGTSAPTPDQLLNTPQSGISPRRAADPLPMPRERATPGLAAEQTQSIHAGSAVGGLQFDNPRLFEVSDAGLSNHLYNSIEASKNSYLRAAQAGPTAVGRMHVGYADHIVQDYFSHSNFVEVGLNAYIGQALADGRDRGGPARGAGDAAPPESQQAFFAAMRAQGDHRGGDRPLVSAQFVAPLFDATSRDKTADSDQTGGRQAITTGTFGGVDTKVSIAHVFLPLLPKLHESLSRSIDTFLGVVEAAPAGATWDTLSAMLASGGRDGAVLQTMIDGLGDAGVGVSAPTGVSLNLVPLEVSPGLIGDPWTVDVPNFEQPMAVQWQDLTLTQGVASFCNAAAQVNDVKRGLQRFARFIHVDAIARAIDAEWDAAKDRCREGVRAQMNQLVRQMLATLTAELRGTPVTPEEAATFTSGNLADCLELASEAVHGAERHTAMAHRLADGDLADSARAASHTDRATDADHDGALSAAERQAYLDAQRAELVQRVGEVRGSGTDADPWVPLAALPPSHSEIGKDHPPHAPGEHAHEHHAPDADPTANRRSSADVDIINTRDDDDARRRAGEQRDAARQAAHPEHASEEDEHEAGSPFYGLGVALALEAQRHLYRQMELVWRQRTGDQGAHFTDFTDERGQAHSGREASERRDREMVVDHGELLGQGATQAARERQRNADQRHFRRAQDSAAGQAEAAQMPAVTDLLNLVDLFISHPDDSTWWRTVMDRYVGAHPAEVYSHIRRRNATRARPGAFGRAVDAIADRL